MGKKKGKTPSLVKTTEEAAPPAVVEEIKAAPVKPVEPEQAPMSSAAKKRAKAKAAKAAAEAAAAPPPAPVEEESTETKKKKTTRGGKRNPNRKLRIEEERRLEELNKEEEVFPSKEQAKNLKAWEKELDALRKSAKTEVMAAPEGRKIRMGVDKITSEIDEKLQLYKRPKPRSTKATMLTRDLKAMKRKDDPEMYDMVEKDRDDALAWQQCEAFRRACYTLRDSCKEVKDSLEANREQEQKITLYKRVASYKKIPIDDIMAKKDEISMRTIDLPSEVSSNLFTSGSNLYRKFQDASGAMIEQHGGKGKGKGSEGGASFGNRQIDVMGFTKDVDSCVAMLKKLDFAGQRTVSFDRNGVSMIVGTKGKNAREFEKEFSIYINTNGNNVTALGSHDNVTAFFDKVKEQVDSQKAEREEKTGSTTVPQKVIPAFIEKVKRLQMDGINIKVGREEGKDKQDVTVRARTAEQVASTLSKINDMIKKFQSKFVEVPAESLDKLYQGKGRGKGRGGKGKGKGDKKDGEKGEKREQPNRLAQDFDSIVRNSGMLIQRAKEGKSGLNIIGEDKDEMDRVIKMITDLSLKSKYETKNVQLDKFQHKVFSANDEGNVAFVEVESGAHNVAIRRNRALDWHLAITGTPEQIAKAEDKVKEVISREGNVETTKVPEALIPNLLRSQAWGIKQLEQYHVQVFCDKKENTVTLVGGTLSVKDALRDLKRQIKEVENQVSKEHKFEEGQGRFLVGKAGNTVRKIRDVSGANVNIDDKTCIAKVTGSPKACEKALKMIEEILAPKAEGEEPSEEQAATSADTKPKKEKGGKGKNKGNKNKKVDLECADMFPTLGSSNNGKNTASSGWGAKKEGSDKKEASDDVPISDESKAPAKPEPVAEAATGC